MVSDKPVCPKQYNRNSYNRDEAQFLIKYLTKPIPFVYFSKSSRFFLDWIKQI